MKDYLEQQGIAGITGSRGAIRQAFWEGIIADWQTWLDMIEARNLSFHSYSGEAAENLWKGREGCEGCEGS
ncbi:MAG: nucleotidyltransferase substrate binding protein [Spirochaetaceae bacterium]|nr:nucleotidyltransferase substrate binding protein [Spirochaetaceae bacterium]